MTKKVVLGILFAIVLPSGALFAESHVAEFRGDGNTITREFEVKAPWILRWRVGSSFPQSTGFELALMDAVTRYQHSRIMRIKTTGSGTKLFTESGRYRFNVSSTFADWDLRVVELTQAEADALVPKKRYGLRAAR